MGDDNDFDCMNCSNHSTYYSKEQLHILLPQGVLTGLGVLGNALFCLVVLLDRKLSTQRTNILLVLMAIGNISYLTSQYSLLYMRQRRVYASVPKTLCKLQFASPVFSCGVCVFSLTACSIDRYLGIVKFRLIGVKEATKPKIFTVIAVIVILILSLTMGIQAWFWATLIGIQKMFFFADWRDPTSGYKWSQLACFLVGYLIPLNIVSFCYFQIILRVMKSNSAYRNQLGAQRQIARRKSGILLLLAITLSFAFLWLPYHVQKLTVAFDYLATINNPYAEFMTQLALYSAISNSILDPILIFTLSNGHRKAVVEHYRRRFRSRKQHAQGDCTVLRTSMHDDDTSYAVNRNRQTTVV